MTTATNVEIEEVATDDLDGVTQTKDFVNEDEEGRDMTVEEVGELAERLASEAEIIRNERITKEELERRQQEADDNHARYVLERENRALRDAKLMTVAKSVQKLLALIENGIEEATTALNQVSEHFFTEVPGFSSVEDAKCKIIEFAKNEVILTKLFAIGGDRRRLAEFLRERGDITIVEIDEETFELATVFNRDVENARKRRQRGQNFSGYLASLRRLKLLTFSYKEVGEKKSIAFMAVKPFAFKVLCEAEKLIDAERARQSAFWQVWKRDVLPTVPNSVSVVDLFTRPELVEARAEFTLNFSPERGSDERQLVGLVLCREGTKVCLELAMHEGKPDVQSWFFDIMPEDPDADLDWYDVVIDIEDPDLRDLPRLLARAVRIAMLSEGFKFPERGARSGPRQKFGGLLAQAYGKKK